MLPQSIHKQIKEIESKWEKIEKETGECKLILRALEIRELTDSYYNNL